MSEETIPSMKQSSLYTNLNEISNKVTCLPMIAFDKHLNGYQRSDTTRVSTQNMTF